MNEPSSLPSPTQSTTPLRSLQEILHNRIIHRRKEKYTSLIIGLIMTTYGYRKIAMDLGSNTNAAETITSRAKSHFL
ncbi:MAG: hypothetical protein M3222_01935 [Thermoproteota archaeon]|nr:hypothetical protein [Thermoproteota archaeon]